MGKNIPGKRKATWKYSEVEQAQDIRSTARSHYGWNAENRGEYKEMRTERRRSRSSMVYTLL